MIEAKDLRIGNLFTRELYTPRGLKYEYEFVLTEEWIGKLFGTNTSIALQDLFPIPLTPEILEKCGFEFNNEYEILSYKDTAICCYWDGVEYCFKYGLDADLTIAACEHLHQLQNLIYALRNEELQIKL